ncbi:MAG: protein kinase [Sandaracinaceae bacterium]
MPVLMPTERLGRELDGRYRLEAILGKGGMGVVYSGRHTGTDRQVAVKVLLPQFIEHREITKRFLREAKSAASLHHPHVVDVLDMGADEDGSPYIVLEFLVGQTLHDRLKKEPVAAEAALAYLLPIMDALALAHEHGIVHRDVKPDNIFLSQDKSGQITPKLLDFGIAKLLQASGSLNTRTGMAMGTPHYMPPEQAQGARDLGPPADVWAMGAVLFRTLTGRFPVEAPDITQLFLKLVEGKVSDLRAVNPEVPEHLAAAVQNALVLAPEERHGGRMRGLMRALLEAAERDGVPVPEWPGRSWADAPPDRPAERDVSDERPSQDATEVNGGRTEVGAADTLPNVDKTLALDEIAVSQPVANPSKVPPIEALPSLAAPRAPSPLRSWASWLGVGVALLLLTAMTGAVLSFSQDSERPAPTPEAPVGEAPEEDDEAASVHPPSPAATPSPEEVVSPAPEGSREEVAPSGNGDEGPAPRRIPEAESRPDPAASRPRRPERAQHREPPEPREVAPDEDLELDREW